MKKFLKMLTRERKRLVESFIHFAGQENLPKATLTRLIFKFLYNKEKELFHIGYNITLDKIDSACYNFIASEANSVSFIAILKGTLPKALVLP